VSNARNPAVRQREIAMAQAIEQSWPRRTMMQKVWQNLPATLAWSAGEGAVIPQLMPAYDMMWLEPANPKLKAKREFIQNAPEGPERQKALTDIANKDLRPEENPDYRAAKNFLHALRVAETHRGRLGGGRGWLAAAVPHRYSGASV
jgi:hypothetical protein